MHMNNQIRIVLLWCLLILCMILHFDYHVSELFYGVDITKPDATGTVPASVVYIRSAFHFLPLLYIAVLLWFATSTVRIIHLVLSGLYTLAHLFHFAGEVSRGNNPSQIILLGITLLLSSLLVVAAFHWLREKTTTL